METKIKWNEGDGYITATYEGSGDGSASISSDVNEGIDREQSIKVETTDKSVSATLIVSQEGLREVFEPSDGLFVLADGGTYNVLKIGNVSPEEPIDTYTRLTYIESTGEQHIALDYLLQETDEIEVLYKTTTKESRDQFLFGSSNSWISTYNLTAYARFGYSSSTSVSNGYYKHKVRLSKGKAVWDGGIVTTSLSYTDLSEGTVNLFAGCNSSGGAYNRGAFMMFYFRIFRADGTPSVDLVPVRRDSDGKVGMLDLVSAKFYGNNDDGEDLIAGGEMQIGEDYERIDRISFNNDKAFDTGIYGNNTTYIDVMFQRTDTSGADYMLGCSSGNRLTAYLNSSGYWRYGSAAPQFNCNKKDILFAQITPTRTDINDLYKTFTTSAFETGYSIHLGGHKGSSNTITKTYQGYIYYFRMWHGDELKVDWYPCRRKSDGVEGFWDCVTQSFVEPI